MAIVEMTPEARAQLARLPLVIQGRVEEVFARLARWPDVSGSKPLRRELKRNWRIRTGDYRVIFRTSSDDQLVTIWRIGYRGDIYDR